MKREFVLSLLIFIVFSQFALSESGIGKIDGTILDSNTGSPLIGLKVEVYPSSDHSLKIGETATDKSGKYLIQVPSEDTYDVYVRTGETHPTLRTYVSDNSLNTLDFKISQSTTLNSAETEKYGFWLVVAVAALIVFLILIDQLFLRKKRVIGDLDRERQLIEKRLEEGKDSQGEDLDDLSKLNKEKIRIEFMINSTRRKYHKNQIDEESFREIVRDYQKQLIEVEAKIAGFNE